ncbi:MAG: lysozyme inhibitor LprI family protein [Pseudomonadota bacterium]|nr:lysozyme inhibitor LprI family protein [Pseudomonadota bacterium]
MQAFPEDQKTSFQLMRATRAGLPLAVALSLVALAFAGTARPETVSCAQADVPAEFAICNSESLQDLDSKLSDAYLKQVEASASRPEKQKLEREQVAWLRERDACKIDLACLAMRYQERLLDLEQSAAAPASGFRRFAER